MDVAPYLVAQQLHREPGFPAVEFGPVDEQARRLVDRDDELVAMNNRKRRRGGRRDAQPAAPATGNSPST